ncbi:hypothetical protein WJX73_008111 [Symbiochloris irregularis]|uniref:Dynein regulatory complex protein 1 C-terminal domain-containing protein n=1 Tax=Symbiochloris irregularis TaxID=706552 RepID=A0AAW1NV26_9CHLO
MELDAFGRAARDKRIAARRARIAAKVAVEPAAGEEGLTIAAVKAQLRFPLQAVAQSKVNMEQVQASTNAKLEGVQTDQAKRDSEHLSKHAQAVERAQELIQQAARDTQEQAAALAAGVQDAEQETLLQYCKQQNEELQEACAHELKTVELALQQERDEQVAQAVQQVTAALTERHAAEEGFLKRYLSSLEDNRGQVEEQYITDAAEFNALKEELEDQTHELMMRTSALRATYCLNQEKLLYMHHVLTQQDSETRALVPQLKKQLLEQGRTLGALRTTLAAATKAQERAEGRLTNEHQRIASHLSDLQTTALKRQLIDLRRFHQVRKLREGQVKELLQQVKDMDAALDFTLFNANAASGSASEGLIGPEGTSTSAQNILLIQDESPGADAGSQTDAAPQDSARQGGESSRPGSPSAKHHRRQQAESALAALGITASSTFQEIDAGLRKYTADVIDSVRSTPVGSSTTPLGSRSPSPTPGKTPPTRGRSAAPLGSRSPSPPLGSRKVTPLDRGAQSPPLNNKSPTRSTQNPDMLETDNLMSPLFDRTTAVTDTMPGSSLARAARDADLQFFMNLNGYRAEVPRSWGLVERGLKDYYRLLQERAAAVNQMTQLRQQYAELYATSAPGVHAS